MNLALANQKRLIINLLFGQRPMQRLENILFIRIIFGQTNLSAKQINAKLIIVINFIIQSSFSLPKGYSWFYKISH